MAEPVNYMTQFAGIPSPTQALLTGIQTAEGLQQMSLKNQQEQKAVSDKLQMEKDLADFYSNPTLQKTQAMMAKYPAYAANWKPLLESRSAEQEQAVSKQAAMLVQPMLKGDWKGASAEFRRQAAASKASGDAAGAEVKSRMADTLDSEETGQAGNNGVLAGYLSFLFAGTKDGPATIKAILDAQKQEATLPADVERGKAEAEKAKIDATFALSKNQADLDKVRNDIEVSKASLRIAQRQADIAASKNELDRQRLQIELDKEVRARDEVARVKTMELETGAATISDAKRIIEDLKADPATLKAITGAAAFKGSMPGTENRAAAGKIDQLSNILASANLDKLKGAMSDKDIVFLKSIGANLDRYQNESKFLNELNRIYASLERGEDRIYRRYGASKPAWPSRTTNIREGDQ